LLHDVAKISGKTNDRNSSDHGLDGGRFLEARNQHDLAEISQRHMLFNLEVPERMPLTWEQKVVFFADKLVETGSVVTIEERIAGLQKRYKIPPVDVARNKPAQPCRGTRNELKIKPAAQDAVHIKKSRWFLIPSSGCNSCIRRWRCAPSGGWRVPRPAGWDGIKKP